MSWKRWEKELEERPKWLAFKVLTLGFCLVTGCSVLAFGLNPFKQAARIVNKTIDADNVLYNYEWFKQRNQDIEALDAKMASSVRSVATLKDELGPRTNWHREDREEVARLSAVSLGLGQQRNDLAAEYNARSQMANRQMFKTGDLPITISIEGN